MSVVGIVGNSGGGTIVGRSQGKGVNAGVCESNGGADSRMTRIGSLDGENADQGKGGEAGELECQ